MTKKHAERGFARAIVTADAEETTCSVCYAEFLDPEDLEVHIQQVHPPRKLVHCQFCQEDFPHAEKYALHIRDEHLSELRSCAYCSRVFADMSLWKKHQSQHTQSMPKGTFSCSQCKLFFIHVYELTQHELTAHNHADDGAFLNEYYSLLSSVINMKADSVIQAIGKEFIYVCSRCKHTGADLKEYISHLQANNCRSLVCDKCFRVYSRRVSLYEHFIKNPECHNIAEESHQKQCAVCKKYFERGALKLHNKVCKVLQCTHCKQEFDSMYALTEHQSNEHPLAVSLAMCMFCRKECVGKIALDKHIERSHKHEFHLYKYTCSYCDTTFKHPQRLFAHYYMKHKDVDPYLCKICDKKFRIRKKFTLHIKLEHSSNGFVEFDERLHVFFTDKKSEKPFQPVAKYAAEETSTEHDKAQEIAKSNENNDDVQLVNVNSDFMNPTETEGNQTDANEKASGRKRKRKTRATYKQNEIDETLKLSDDCDSEEETLLNVKKKAKIQSQMKKRLMQWNKRKYKKDLKRGSKKRFTCNICKKYCYTFQNYHNHMSMHFKDESKKCVKCSLSFKHKTELQRHLVEQHSTSKLTETLKNLLERRKKGEKKEEISMTKKFLNTIKKVKFDHDHVSATLTPVSKELSVQKFIENFTPEVSEGKNVQVKNSVSFTKVTGPVAREPAIKMTKFKPAPVINEARLKLAMPVRFKKTNERHSVTIRKVESHYQNKLKFDFDNDNDDQFQDYDNDYYNQEDNKESCIPEVEQEVTLEGTEEPPKRNPATHKIVLPKLPKELKSIRIAHLLPEAPYYKIVKMDDIIQKAEKDVDEPAKIVKKTTPVRLPDGTKLVTVNPLAHLLGDTPVDKLVTNPNNKYYKTKPKNFEDVLAKALLKLETPKKAKKKVEKKVKSTEGKVSDKTEVGDVEQNQTEPEIVKQMETPKKAKKKVEKKRVKSMEAKVSDKTEEGNVEKNETEAETVKQIEINTLSVETVVNSESNEMEEVQIENQHIETEPV